MWIEWHDAHDNAFIRMWLSTDRPKERVQLEQPDYTEIFQGITPRDKDISKINIKPDFYAKQTLGQNFYNYLRRRDHV